MIRKPDAVAMEERGALENQVFKHPLLQYMNDALYYLMQDLVNC